MYVNFRFGKEQRNMFIYLVWLLINQYFESEA